MLRIFLALVVLFWPAACVLPGDLAAMEQRVIERSQAEDKDVLTIFGEELAETREKLEADIDSGLETLGATGGVAGTALLGIWHAYRNHTRKKQLASAGEG